MLAEVSDAENPVDGDSFYVVSPGGAIGCYKNDEDIDWLFLTDSGADGAFIRHPSNCSEHQILPEMRKQGYSGRSFLQQMRQ